MIPYEVFCIVLDNHKKIAQGTVIVSADDASGARKAAVMEMRKQQPKGYIKPVQVKVAG